MTSLEVYDLLKECSAIPEGHFLLTSGLHSGLYVEKFQVLQHPQYTERLCREIADRFRKDRVQLVVGPVTGGVILSYEVGKQLGTRAVFTERENGKMALRRGFRVSPGERVLVVEDIVTTGGSILEVIEVLKALGAEIVGAGLLVERSAQGKEIELGVRKEALLKLSVAAYPPDACPLCREGKPLVKPGSRKN